MAGREKRAYSLKIKALASKHGKEIQRKRETVIHNKNITSLSALSHELGVKAPSTLNSWLSKDCSREA